MEKNSYDNTNEENWTSLGYPIYKKSFDDDSSLGDSNQENLQPSEYAANKHRLKILSPVVTLQLVICLTVLIFSYLSNAFLAEKFTAVKEAFDKELYASMLFDGKLKDIDYSEMFDLDE